MIEMALQRTLRHRNLTENKSMPASERYTEAFKYTMALHVLDEKNVTFSICVDLWLAVSGRESGKMVGRVSSICMQHVAIQRTG